MPVMSLSEFYEFTTQLHGTRERHHILKTIEAIALGLSGSDEIAIFEVDPSRSQLELATASGIEGTDLGPIRIGTGLIGRAVESGELYERFEEPEASVA